MTLDEYRRAFRKVVQAERSVERLVHAGASTGQRELTIKALNDAKQALDNLLAEATEEELEFVASKVIEMN